MSLDYFQKGDQVVYVGDTWPKRYGWDGTVLFAQDLVVLVRFDEHGLTTSCAPESLVPKHQFVPKTVPMTLLLNQPDRG